MGVLLDIFASILAPIFILVGAGVFLERRFKFDIATLSKLNFYIFMPALIFAKLVESRIDWSGMVVVALFQAVLIFVLLAVNLALSKAMALPAGLASAYVMAAVFCNSGNYGIPLVELVFPNSAGTAVSYQAVTVMVQNLLTFTLGLVIIGHGKARIGQSLKYTLRLPFIYVIAAALALKWYDVPVTEWVWFWKPVSYAGDGLVAVALITLGVQIAKTPRVTRRGALGAANFMRLAAAPIVAFALVRLFGVFYAMPPLLARLVVIAAAGPSAVNTVLIGIELRNEPEFAASAVFYSTIFSAVSVAVTIFLVRSFM